MNDYGLYVQYTYWTEGVYADAAQFVLFVMEDIRFWGKFLP